MTRSHRHATLRAELLRSCVAAEELGLAIMPDDGIDTPQACCCPFGAMRGASYGASLLVRYPDLSDERPGFAAGFRGHPHPGEYNALGLEFRDRALRTDGPRWEL